MTKQDLMRWLIDTWKDTPPETRVFFSGHACDDCMPELGDPEVRSDGPDVWIQLSESN